MKSCWTIAALFIALPQPLIVLSASGEIEALQNAGPAALLQHLLHRHRGDAPQDKEPGDVLFVSSVSGRTIEVVNLAYDMVQAGVNVIALTSMEYARAVEPVHEKQ